MRRSMVLLLMAMACTSASQSPANLSQATTFWQTASTASTAAMQYEQAATAATTQANCTAALQQYVARMQPLLDQMRSMAVPMDRYMNSAGKVTAGDMDCGIQVMADELAHHQSVACTSSDMAVNRTEVQRHADAMQSFAEHMQMRAVQAGGMMGGSGRDGGSGQMMNPGWMGGSTDGGWMMPDGGMMQFDQPMPGCTYAAGGYQASDGGWADAGSGTAGPGSMTDGGMPSQMDGGSGPMMDGGSGAMMDGGMMGGGLAGGAKACEPPARCAGPAMMAPNYVCPDQTVAGPACVALADGSCAWRMLTCQ